MNSEYYEDMFELIGDPYPNSKTKIFCNSCQTKTNHKRALGPINREFSFIDDDDDDDEKSWAYIYNIWICAGCEEVTFEIMEAPSWIVDPSWSADDLSWGGDENSIKLAKEYMHNRKAEGFTSHYYPTRTKERIRKRSFFKLPSKISNIYDELIHAYNEGLLILCSIGMRCLLEGICLNRGATENNSLKEKIEILKGDLPENIVDNLHEFRFMGNESTHELEKPQKWLLKRGISILESILDYLYDLDSRASFFKLSRNNNFFLD